MGFGSWLHDIIGLQTKTAFHSAYEMIEETRMFERQPEPVTPHDIDVTQWMQEQCVQTYLRLGSALHEGMTEKEIAHAVTSELARRGISDFWYDIPVIVLIGQARLLQMRANDYEVKRPSADYHLMRGTPIFIDMHPRHSHGRWGNFAATGIFQADPQHDYDAIRILQQLQEIQQDCIGALRGDWTARDVAQWFADRFQADALELVDVRDNFGHDMHRGAKTDVSGTDKRTFLDQNHGERMGGRIWGLEPSGARRCEPRDSIIVGRFEDCVYVPPEGRAVLLGRKEGLPVIFG